MIYVYEGGTIIYDESVMTDEMKAVAVAIEEIPQAEFRSGYTPVLKADLTSSTVYYEYVKNSEVEELKTLLADALALLDESGVL